MPDPADTPRPTRFRTGGLSPRKPTRFAYRPGPEERAQLAHDLDLIALHALEMLGEITPSGRDELVLTARLVAAADQACVVTLAPVPARIETPVLRRYVAGLTAPEGEETEMPEDDTVEPMPETIDLAEIAVEALALALPEYPRADGAAFDGALHAGDGVAPLQDDDVKPFAGLKALADRLASRDDSGSDKG